MRESGYGIISIIMAIIKGVGSDFFGLDIGRSSIKVVQLSSTGPNSWSLKHYGYAPIDLKTSMADSQEARKRLGEVITTVVGQSGIKTTNVAIGIPASKAFVTVVDVPKVTMEELTSTMNYQIDQYIPMDVDSAKIDWKSLGQSYHDPSQLEVLVASTPRDYAEERLELIEGLGFDVVAVEPDPLAMVRSVASLGAQDAQMIVDIGEQSINVVFSYADAPRLVRTIPNGLESFVSALNHGLGVQEEQARQFVMKFGLAPDKLEGKIVSALTPTLTAVVSELAKSVKFLQSRYPTIVVNNIQLAGGASTIPLLSQYLVSKLGISVSVANPWQRVTVSNNDQQFAAVSSEFAIAVGLAQRRGDI